MDPKSGGPSHALRELARIQHSSGQETEILATDAQAGQTWQDGSSFHRQITSEPLFKNVAVKLVSSVGRRRPWSRYSWAPTVRGILKKKFLSTARPDVIHIHGVFSHITQTAAQTASRCGIPYIIRPAGALDTGCLHRGHSVLKRTYISVFLRRMLRNCAFVHVTSEQESEPIRRQFPGVRIEIVPHGTELSDAEGGEFRRQLAMPEDSPFLLCLSRIHPIKRLDLAIRAFATLTNDFPKLRLVIAGNDAGALEDLKRLAADQRLVDRCLFVGFVTGPDKAKAYSEARLFLHPSAHENFGLSVVEAMAYGCPVVTTQGVASGRYVEQARAGRVVRSETLDIAQALRELLGQPREVPGNRGAKFVEENLTWPRIVDRLSSLYESLVTRSQAC